MATWKKVGDNLVRHSGGTIYLRARVDGKPIRVSLHTNDLRIAKIARDSRLAALREEAEQVAKENGGGASARTVGDFLAVVEKRIILPHLKAATVRNYKFTFGTLRSSLDVQRKAQLYHESDAAAWWRGYAKSGCAQTVNLGLSLAKKLGGCMVDAGMSVKNPFASLKRMPIRKTTFTIPTDEELQAVVAEIRSQGLRCSNESAYFVECLAYCGARIGEVREVLWQDVEPQWLTITGGAKGTKNRKHRRIPINPRLRGLLERMGWQDGKPPEGMSLKSKVFQILTPRIALQNACKRLGMSHIHPHLLRHYFASLAIERGVDIPTVSRWLGHSDGGALAMKTYSHLRDDHSLIMASNMG